MQNNGSHIISFNIRLSDPGDRKKTLEQVCDEMRQDLKSYPELSKAQVILGGSNTGLTGQSTADFEIYGYDMSVTDSVAANLKRQLYQIKGVSEVNISRSDYQPEYQVDFDREKLAMHGLNLSTAGTYLRNRVNGAIASQYREDGDEYDIKVRYAPEFRTSLESLENIIIYNGKGEAVRVKELGKVVERFTPPTIERKDRERIITVSAVISGEALGDVVAAGNDVIDNMDIPAGVTVQVAGSFEDQQESFQDLGVLGVLIVILVFIVMAALVKPKLLLLDEHTAALDPKTSDMVMELTKKIVESHQLTTLMITHNMRDAIRYGNRLIMMNEGHVIYDVRGEEKTKLEVSDLLQRFEQAGGEANDRMILS
jgi:HAE1 family hydrophobic/amphiphilic exporter-1